MIPLVRYDKNHKTISVTYSFNIGMIPKVKILAPRGTWLAINFEASPDPITFDFIEPYLSRPSRKVLKGLLAYSSQYPDDFQEDVFACANASLGVNPLTPGRRKDRGDGFYELSPRKMEEVRNTARHLYILLKCNPKDPMAAQLLQAYRVDESMNPKQAVMEIIENFYDFRMATATNTTRHDSFYKKYVALKGLRRLENSWKRRLRIIQGNPFLEKLKRDF